jgi:rubrerythrin
MELQEALGAAIEFEHKVRDYYARCAQETADPKGKRIFTVLAQEEQGHVDYLESRLGEWRRTGAVLDADLPTVLPPPAWIHKEAAKLSAYPPDVAVTGSPELDFLKEALDMERKTSGFYRDLTEVLEVRFQHLFARFMEIEEGHLTLVQAEIDALVGHGHWFDFMEFRLEQ